MTLRTPLTAIAASSVAALTLMSGSPASALAPTPTHKPKPTSSSGTHGTRVSAQDQQYLIQAHQGNLAEIAAGHAAKTKGKSKEVRSIGAIMVADHTKLDNKLKKVAERYKVTLPTQATARQQAKYKELEGLSGANFDKAWVKTMIYGHRAAMVAAKKEVANGSVSQVKAVAKASEPVIQDHLNRLLAAEKSVGALGEFQPPTLLTVSAATR
ncbi:DUF4142 domain-containing protein [Streptosporangium sp. NPDC087985]|uniref:DUF4142 domain-containing protein n=1 Tax=Streptosporangium sp. NPDC087985 TaxID=3366196 RepID=UPI0038228D17